jgi:hypothetical protein
MIYTYLCEKCSLANPELNLTYTFRSENGLNSWQTDRIDITPNKETKISLVKAKTDGNEGGYWGIYIAECPEIIDNKGTFSLLLLVGSTVRFVSDEPVKKMRRGLGRVQIENKGCWSILYQWCAHVTSVANCSLTLFSDCGFVFF